MHSLRPTFVLVGTLLLAPACRSAAEHRADADREVYAILDDVRARLVENDRFRLERESETLRQRILSGEVQDDGLPPLTLVDALRIAADNSREFQTRRESLYLRALDLTLERWNFSVQELGALGAFLNGDGDGATTAGADGALTLSKLFATGASVLGSIGFDIVRDVSTGDAWGAFTNLSLNITQPILRGYGSDVVREPLTQAERDVLYEARSFERFRRTFAVDVATRYYRVLEERDTLQNEQLNYQLLVQLRERNELFADAGRLSDIQVDQARQDELRAQNRVVEARRRLEDALDQFKLFLGLPVGVKLTADENELERIQEFDNPIAEADEERLTEIALRERLDHQNALGRLEDASRRVHVLADALRAGLDLSLGATATSDENQPFDFSSDSVAWTAAVDLDLPIDRLPERNAYRAGLISLDAARRDAEESGDFVVADLRDARRALEAARESYEIQRGAVQLAARRVESAALNLEAGRASTRDVLEAQESQVEARNAATGALVDRFLAELALYRDLELLRVGEEGLTLATDRIDVEPQPEGAP